MAWCYILPVSQILLLNGRVLTPVTVTVAEARMIMHARCYAEYLTLSDSVLTITMRSSLTVVTCYTKVEVYEGHGGVSLNYRSRIRIQMCLTSKALATLQNSFSF